jgi:hypothetical protein
VLSWKALMTGKKEMCKQKPNVKNYVSLKLVLHAGISIKNCLLRNLVLGSINYHYRNILQDAKPFLCVSYYYLKLAEMPGVT